MKTCKIVALSVWVQFYRKKAAIAVQVWRDELRRGARKSISFLSLVLRHVTGFLPCSDTVDAPKKLYFLYLANDVLQTARRKGRTYFGSVAGCVLQHAVVSLLVA
jgi:hypothetical protein